METFGLAEGGPPEVDVARRRRSRSCHRKASVESRDYWVAELEAPLQCG